MQNTVDNPSRRRFLRSAVRISTGVLTVGLLSTSMITEAKPAKVSEDSTLAKSLHYHHNAKEVQAGGRNKGEFCKNCQFFQGQADDQWGPCQIFQGKLVAAKGWCTSYTAAS